MKINAITIELNRKVVNFYAACAGKVAVNFPWTTGVNWVVEPDIETSKKIAAKCGAELTNSELFEIMTILERLA